MRSLETSLEPNDTPPVTKEWIWVTTLPQDEVPTRNIVIFGHERWRIENEGFNELVAHWHSGHVFHLHANSLLVLWLVMFIAHAVFHCFLRNLQPALRNAHTAIHFAARITSDLYAGHWWPCRSP